ncbi:hypothetical protein COS53_01695 [Candidatus Shapirobacteria bacterium CG03_land_8_20_14_0_80_35_14]|uniref:Uncharacterized protein n=1 Tax=Candidatus Shapirobacteria bacterium CG03_land_8_20_14_0_80_35_14 TaxID=1974878 RepID=A0A2M7BQ61_9BACT|nr:MAG: hypothetical protein COS53_01695 [Candidatus Shapirobacteria bacterium CG03_land_8_20_14_0_80_35_14]
MSRIDRACTLKNCKPTLIYESSASSADLSKRQIKQGQHKHATNISTALKAVLATTLTKVKGYANDFSVSASYQPAYAVGALA